MGIQTFSDSDFIRNVSAAKQAAENGPVFITDGGHPAYVLLKIKDYYAIVRKGEPSLLDLMDSIPGGEGVEFIPPRLGQLKSD